ncbi:MAG: FimB/Mfa2 family fimbrial subunit [Rikenellaceae bacterium]
MKIAVFVQRVVLRSLFALFAVWSVGCTKVGGVVDPDQPTSTVTFVSKASSDVEYPITFCALGADGALVKSITISGEGDQAQMELSQGDYMMVAIAGTSGYDVSGLNTVSSVIKYPGTAAAGALMMGSANVTLSGTTTVNITLSYKVAKLSVSLVDVPGDVSEVSVSFSPVCDGVNLYGEYSSDSQMQSVSLTKADDIWSSGEFYLFAGSQTNTVLTINFTSTTSGNESYGFTMSEALAAATPYLLTGSYSGGVIVEGQFSTEGWNEQQSISFEFGEAVSGDSSGGDSSDGGSSDGGSSDSGSSGDTSTSDDYPTYDVGQDYVFSVSSLPSVATLWNGHIVYAVDLGDSDDTATIWLLSVDQWSELAAADAVSTAEGYSEGSLIEWEVPSGTQASALQVAVLSGDNLVAFNQLRSSLGGGDIVDSDSQNSGVWFMCEDGSNTYRFYSSGLTLGDTSSFMTYNLLLVRPVSVKIVD